MIIIHKKNEPRELWQAKQNGCECYEDLAGNVRDAIRKQLYEEQGGICGYCMRRIQYEELEKLVPIIKIEHYTPRHPKENERSNESTIDYRNMILVCDGNSGSKKNAQTCDTHKGNTPITVNPFDIKTINKIKYKRNGLIYSADVDINRDLNETLNLNCDAVSLPDNREAALRSLQTKIKKDLKNKQGDSAYWDDLYHKINDKNPKMEYVGILLDYLQNKIVTARRT